jgi:glycine/D-amino acid oxidase-like deaminating enzyme
MKIAVIGAGFGGMAAAYDLRRQGHDVTCLIADYVGDWRLQGAALGLVGGEVLSLGSSPISGCSVHPRAGLAGEGHFPWPQASAQQQWYPFDSITKALLFPGLGFGLDKIRFGFVGLFLRLTNGWKALERHTADAWMTRWAGRRVSEVDRARRQPGPLCEEHGLMGVSRPHGSARLKAASGLCRLSRTGQRWRRPRLGAGVCHPPQPDATLPSRWWGCREPGL